MGLVCSTTPQELFHGLLDEHPTVQASDLHIVKYKSPKKTVTYRYINISHLTRRQTLFFCPKSLKTCHVILGSAPFFKKYGQCKIINLNSAGSAILFLCHPTGFWSQYDNTTQQKSSPLELNEISRCANQNMYELFNLE